MAARKESFDILLKTFGAVELQGCWREDSQFATVIK
jgi:hypothetical protein